MNFLDNLKSLDQYAQLMPPELQEDYFEEFKNATRNLGFSKTIDETDKRKVEFCVEIILVLATKP